MADPAYEVDPVDASLDAPAGAPMPQLPDRVEALTWLYVEREQRPQAWVAAQLRMNQSSVSRALARACTKISALATGGWIDLDRLEQLLRKHVGPSFAPRRT